MKLTYMKETNNPLKITPGQSMIDHNKMLDSSYSTKFTLNKKKSEENFKNSVF